MASGSVFGHLHRVRAQAELRPPDVFTSGGPRPGRSQPSEGRPAGLKPYFRDSKEFEGFLPKKILLLMIFAPKSVSQRKTTAHFQKRCIIYMSRVRVLPARALAWGQQRAIPMCRGR
jgi:hypothetical protein